MRKSNRRRKCNVASNYKYSDYVRIPSHVFMEGIRPTLQLMLNYPEYDEYANKFIFELLQIVALETRSCDWGEIDKLVLKQLWHRIDPLQRYDFPF